MSSRAWIIYNGFLQADSFYDFANMIREAAEALGHDAELHTNNEIISILDNNLHIQRQDLPDYVVFTDKDIYLARQLELLDVPVFNSSAAITTSDDKIKTYQLLAKVGLPIPKTIVAPKTFGIPSVFDEQYLQYIKQTFSFPFVMKEAFGSFGEQVYLIENDDDLMTNLAKMGDKPFMFQQFIETSFGKDLRLQVVGDKVVAAMKRTSDQDFRANVTNGGKMKPHKPTIEEAQLAIRASQLIGADFSGVDLLFGHHGPIVCEINSNAHIRNIFDCTGINAAYDIVQYIDGILDDIT